MTYGHAIGIQFDPTKRIFYTVAHIIERNATGTWQVRPKGLPEIMFESTTADEALKAALDVEADAGMHEPWR